MSAEPTTADEIEVARSCGFELKRANGRPLRTAIRMFAGLPRLADIDGVRMRFEVLKGDLLSYTVSLKRGSATGIVPYDPGRDVVERRLAELADVLEQDIRSTDATFFDTRMSVDRPWAFKASPLLVAAIAQAGVAPEDYLCEMLARTRGRRPVAATRHGPPVGKTSSRKGLGLRPEEDQRSDLPWDMPDHCTSFDGHVVRLHDIRIGVGAVWGERLHNGTDAALSIRSLLPATIRIGAVGHPVNRLVDSPLLADVDAPVTRIMRKGGSSVMLVDPGIRHLAAPPPAVAARIARMRDAVQAITKRESATESDRMEQHALF